MPKGRCFLSALRQEEPRPALETQDHRRVRWQVDRAKLNSNQDPDGTQLLQQCETPPTIGVLFRLVWFKLEGAGLDRCYSIYQGQLFSKRTPMPPALLPFWNALFGASPLWRKKLGSSCLNRFSETLQPGPLRGFQKRGEEATRLNKVHPFSGRLLNLA